MPPRCGRCSRRPNRSSTSPRHEPDWRAPRPRAPARPGLSGCARSAPGRRSTRGGRVMAGVAVRGRGERPARGHRRRPGLPQPLPAVAVRGRPGDRLGRPLARRPHQLWNGHRWIVDRLPDRSRMRAAAAAAAGIGVPVVAALPAGITAAPTYAVVSGTVVTFTFDAALARAAAARAGGQLPAMPAGLDGSTLTVSIQPGRGDLVRRRPGGALHGGTARCRRADPAFIVVASRTPTVSSTGVTARQLENYLLSVPGFPRESPPSFARSAIPTRPSPFPSPSTSRAHRR